MEKEEKNVETVAEATSDTSSQPLVSEDELKIPESAQTGPDKHTNVVALLGVLTVLLVLILVGLYLWSTSMGTSMPTMPADESETDMIEEDVIETSTTPQMEVETVSDPAEAETLEELDTLIEDSTLDELDAEFEAIEAEIDAALE